MKIDKLVFVAGDSANSSLLQVHPRRITLFIGPNNGGKSRALIEIQQSLNPTTNYSYVVFKEVIRSPIDSTELEEKLSKIQRPKLPGENASPDVIAVEGRIGRQQVHLSILQRAISNPVDEGTLQYFGSSFLRYFYINLGGSDRLSLTNATQAEPVGTPPKTTIAALHQNDVIREELSEIVFKAFDQYLVIDPTQMPNIQYKLSDTKAAGNIEKRLDAEAAAFFKKSMALADASDGTKAFIGILAEVMAGDPDVIFIDEPEAFLHPSLQYILGQQISAKALADKQIYVATHSPSFLLGCVLSGAIVDIVRLTHRSGSATARYLDSTRVRKLMTDPLFRSVGAANALFHESAVVVEGDSDRAFYEEINSRINRYGDGGIRHASFLNAHNKQTAVNIVRPLRDIGIPAASILDIDWIKEDGQVWDRYFESMGAPLGLKESLATARRSVRKSLEGTGKDYKREGGIDLLSGDAKLSAIAFFDQIDSYGLFTVRTGELESWLRNMNVERTKSKWLISIFNAMRSDPKDTDYLKPADDDVWELLRRVAKWTANSSRLGMVIPGGGTPQSS